MAVCGVVPAAAIYSAGIVAWRIYTGTIGITEGPLLLHIYIYPSRGHTKTVISAIQVSRAAFANEHEFRRNSINSRCHGVDGWVVGELLRTSQRYLCMFLPKCVAN